jgi:hypothetical protein
VEKNDVEVCICSLRHKTVFVYRSLVEIPSNSFKFAKIWFIDIQVLEFLMVYNYNSKLRMIWTDFMEWKKGGG